MTAAGAGHGPGGATVSEPGREMHFLEHLEELRWVILHSIIGTAVGTVAGWFLSPVVLEYVIRHTVGRVALMSVMESFNERCRLAIILGLMLALPYVLYRVWSFVVPGLMRKERRLILPLLLSSLALFVLGGAFGFFMVVPAILEVLKKFRTPSMIVMLRLHDVLGFVYNMCLASGILFQLPLVTLMLSWIGLVTPAFLLSKWRHAIVLTLILTAAVTPGDVVWAQVFMGIPIVLLYFLSVALAYLVRRRPKEAPDVPGALGA
ncbi:MAG TPA: twin-arginine translocase subunit TatC [Candidatus Saccharimonadales bacterium]|nr:twin-arginine translocase subunit TatC [Candidatus Saccharimonadales bacterium]